jgi:hypothetical protein
MNSGRVKKAGFYQKANSCATSPIVPTKVFSVKFTRPSRPNVKTVDERVP